MDTTPLVAIIVLNYNGEKCLPQALQSLRDLTYEAKKIIVVDNNSQDRSLQIAQKNFPECIFLKKSSNTGFAAGMNSGIREALRIGAGYVWLFNNDAVAEKDALTQLVCFCESRSDVGAVSPCITEMHGKTWFFGGDISYFRMRASHREGLVPRFPYESEYLSGCALLLPCSVIKTVGLLDERYFLYYEDVDISMRIRQMKKKLFILPGALVQHGEQSEIQNPKKYYYLVYSGLLFFREHTPIYFRPWIWGYERLRRFKNFLDVLFARKGATNIRDAYREYDRIHQTTTESFSHLR